MGPSEFTTARPISAPYSSWRRRIDSGEPSNPERLASTTGGRLPLAAFRARASFFDDCGKSAPPPELRPSPGRSRAEGAAATRSHQAHGPAAEMGTTDHGGLTAAQVAPALERVVLIHHAEITRQISKSFFGRGSSRG